MRINSFLITWVWVVLAAWPVGSAKAQTFTKVADFQSSIPTGTGTFTDLGHGEISGSNVVFYGTGSNSQKGIYLWNGTALSKVADLNTPIPGGTGNFTNITFYAYSVNGSTVVFTANGTISAAAGLGIYQSVNGGALSNIVSTATNSPLGGKFALFSPGSIAENGSVIFGSTSSSGAPGIFSASNGVINTIIASNTVLPILGNPNFGAGGVDFVVYDSGKLAFTAYSPPEGIVSYAGGTLYDIADPNITMPDFGVKFTTNFFSSPPAINGTTVVFSAFVNLSGFKYGVYKANIDGSGLTTLVDSLMTAPGTTNKYGSINSFNYSGGTLVFTANTTNQPGVYMLVGGAFSNVLVPGATLNSKTVKSASAGGFDGNNAVLLVTFTDNSKALYTTALGTPVANSSFTSRVVTPGGFQMNLSLTAGQNYRLQGTTNVADSATWSTLTNISTAPASLQYTDSTATNLQLRFYRVVSP